MKTTVLVVLAGLMVACGAPMGMSGGGSAAGGGSANGGGSAGGGSAGGGTSTAGGGTSSAGGGTSTAGGGTSSSGGGTAAQPLPCTPEGFTTAPAAIPSTAYAFATGDLNLDSAESDVTGLPSLKIGSSVRLNVTAPQGVAHTELTVRANGCPVGKIQDFGEEFWWTTRPTDASPPKPRGNSFMTLEVERQGTIVLREVVALPQRLANVTSPVKGAAFNGPFRVTWEPLGLAALSLTQPSSNVVGWRSAGGGGLMTMNLGAPAFVDASGQVDVTGSSQVKNLELSFSGRKGQLTLRFRVNVPVN